MDALSQVLRGVRLTGVVYFIVEAAEPRVVETPPGAVIAPHVGGGGEHVLDHHVVTAGRC